MGGVWYLGCLGCVGVLGFSGGCLVLGVFRVCRGFRVDFFEQGDLRAGYVL